MEFDRTEVQVPLSLPLSPGPISALSPLPTPLAKRSLDVWFEDGTLILEAEGTLFKVFRGILAANSTVFNDMLVVGSYAEEETVDGCPVVRVYDAAVDLMHFLKALHHVGYYNPPETTSFTLIAAVLRLSTKYNVDFLRRRALAHISSLYPTTLQDWEQRRDNAIEVFNARPFAVFQLAKETGHEALLPACMYLCADTVDINDILDGLKSIDGKHIELDWLDKRACIRGRQNLLLALRAEVFGFLTGTLKIPNCTNTARCDSAKLRWLQSLEASLGNGCPGIFSIKFPWSSFRKAICEVCYTASYQDSMHHRQTIWDNLPSYFDMPPWEELVKST
ncbi:Glutamine amidotransferase type-1 domain-containing protein [Mycena indigotica]|uniref:Glutamine amidotransferase type-1 domain-containing protein n=1 Tax=Mycena indigotica TaxID=2126181 RepID=A0A8H6VZF3_9AGAR|nr:Glutamine amidotransferase type-1 domain-containing protein [Mycena indigotica]KAF7297451.1 Glutamine amidotransferase type-1 domain-containing protein [Mycena indigotica]